PWRTSLSAEDSMMPGRSGLKMRRYSAPVSTFPQRREIIVHAVQGQLVADPVLALAEGAHPSPNGRHVLADGEVEAFHKRGLDLPAACCQHGVDTIERAEHHPVRHIYQAPAPYGLDHLRVEQTRPRQPARLGRRAVGLTTWELYPLPIVGEQ